MYRILESRQLTEVVHLLEVEAPWVVKHALPGQFVIVISDAKGERIPLTIADIDEERQSITLIIQAVGYSSSKLCTMKTGEALYSVVGPLGHPIDIINNGYKGRTLLVCGGVGTAPIYPIAKWLHQNGLHSDAVVGARKESLLFYNDEIRAVCDNVYQMTDDGSNGNKGIVTDKIKELVLLKGEKYDLCIAIGPMIMMKSTSLLTKELSIPTLVSLDCLMVDGTGMCGACRVQVNGRTKFTCVDGPIFDGHYVDYDEAKRHLTINNNDRKTTELLENTGYSSKKGCEIPSQPSDCDTHPAHRQHPMEQPAEIRAHNFEEVSYGFNCKEAMTEASRCLQCKVPPCVKSCPVNIQIPRFIHSLRQGNTKEALRIIHLDSSLPAICGRVCPQEAQCEGSCILGKKGEPIAIGALERFAADHGKDTESEKLQPETKTLPGKKVAIIGSGPSGLACATDLARKGYRVTIFEALHHAGGVLVYGIPEFRLPKRRVVEPEIESLLAMGVEIKTNVIVGKSITVDELMEHEGFAAIYIASGAGLPKFMGIPGEGLVGVISANELLTRTNLMHGYDENYATPIFLGQRVAVVGGGNVAMDAARTALRLGSDVTVVYRRSEAEMPARREEVMHARQEGIRFELLTNPVAILDDKTGNVSALRCVRMALGESDTKGRRSVSPIQGSEFEIPVATVVMAIGTSPNPLLKSTTLGLETDHHGCITIDEVTRMTSRPGVFAGGDAVSGAATVILAMGAGREAAATMDEYLKRKQ